MDDLTLHAWVTHVFDHPVTEKNWYFGEDAPEWTGPRDQVPELIAETFERAGDLLARFPDDRLDQGFWYLVGETPPPHFMETLVDEGIPVAVRVRALKSFVPLFEQIMAVRCMPRYSYQSDMNPLNNSCFMWWDLLRFSIWYWHAEDGSLKTTAWSSFHDDIFAVIRRILAIPHDACRGSALHGLGHLARDYPDRREQFSELIDEFLGNTPGVCAEVADYVDGAKTGQVQ